MRLLHYSDTPIESVRSMEQAPRSGRAFGTYDKPRGLWVSVEGEDDWRNWCEAEQFGNPAAQICYEVTLRPDANVLRLDSAGALYGFTDEYSEQEAEWYQAGGIRWDRVAGRYAGIIIAPYAWECRLNEQTPGYYPWDCASGCIWDASAVERIDLVSDPVVAAHTPPEEAR